VDARQKLLLWFWAVWNSSFHDFILIFLRERESFRLISFVKNLLKGLGRTRDHSLYIIAILLWTRSMNWKLSQRLRDCNLPKYIGSSMVRNKNKGGIRPQSSIIFSCKLKINKGNLTCFFDLWLVKIIQFRKYLWFLAKEHFVSTNFWNLHFESIPTFIGNKKKSPQTYVIQSQLSSEVNLRNF